MPRALTVLLDFFEHRFLRSSRKLRGLGRESSYGVARDLTAAELTLLTMTGIHESWAGANRRRRARDVLGRDGRIGAQHGHVQ